MMDLATSKAEPVTIDALVAVLSELIAIEDEWRTIRGHEVAFDLIERKRAAINHARELVNT